MTTSIILNYTLNSMILILMISLPAIMVASIVGILVSLVQAVTQIQDQTLSFSVKLIAIIVAIIFTARWGGSQLLNFAENIFTNFPNLVN